MGQWMIFYIAKPLFWLHVIIIFYNLWLTVKKKKSSIPEIKDSSKIKAEDNIKNEHIGYIAVTNVIGVIILSVIIIWLLKINTIALAIPVLLCVANLRQMINYIRNVFNSSAIIHQSTLPVVAMLATVPCIILSNDIEGGWQQNINTNFDTFFKISFDVLQIYLLLFVICITLLEAYIMSLRYRKIHSTAINKMESFINGYIGVIQFRFNLSKNHMLKIMVQIILFACDVLNAFFSIVLGMIFGAILFLDDLITNFVKQLLKKLSIQTTEEGVLLFAKNMRIISKWCLIIAIVLFYGIMLWNNHYEENVIELYSFIGGVIVIPMFISSILEK